MPTGALRQALILVIDDDAALLHQAGEVLRAAGYACHLCSTAEAALDFARCRAPDLILSDVNLRGRSGLELCEHIKEDPALCDVPVMFLSGGQTPDIIRRHDTVGSAYYLRKPFDADVLLELIDKALWTPHAERQSAIAGAT